MEQLFLAIFGAPKNASLFLSGLGLLQAKNPTTPLAPLAWCRPGLVQAILVTLPLTLLAFCRPGLVQAIPVTLPLTPWPFAGQALCRHPKVQTIPSNPDFAMVLPSFEMQPQWVPGTCPLH